MGCDISKQTLKYFQERTEHVTESVVSLKEEHANLKKQLETLALPSEPESNIQELKDSLIPHLAKIEKMLNEIRSSKEEKDSKKEKNKNEDQKKKFQVSTKAESQEPLSRESPNVKNGKEVMSILDDPAIKAMIEKNRQKFVGKKK